jgi:hypothetical protein
MPHQYVKAAPSRNSKLAAQDGVHHVKVGCDKPGADLCRESRPLSDRPCRNTVLDLLCQQTW